MVGSKRARVKFDDADNLLLSTAELCNILAVSPEMISRYHKAGMPKASTGWWNLRQVLAYLGQGGSDNTNNKTVSGRKLMAEAEYKEAKAARERITLEALQGQYIKKSDVISQWQARVADVKSSLLLLAKNVSKEFTDIDTRIVVERVVKENVYEYLESYSREGAYTQTEKDTNKKKSTK